MYDLQIIDEVKLILNNISKNICIILKLLEIA